MESEKSSILGQNFRKIITILIGLVLIVSGLIITTIPVGAGARGPRADADTMMNDNAPAITINMNAADIHMNNMVVTLNITVIDDDEVHNETYYNGTHIDMTMVYVNLSSLGGSATETMGYLGNFAIVDANDTRNEGIYTYDLDLGTLGIEAADYQINFTAYDTGDSVNMTHMNMSTETFTLKVGQFNRPPIYDGPGSLISTIDEDGYNMAPYYEVDFTALFSDVDVNDGPFNNTAADTLTYLFMAPTGNMTSGSYAFDNYTIMFNGTAGLHVMTLENVYTDAAGEDIDLAAVDGQGESVEKTWTLIVSAMNDPPMIPMVNEWLVTENNTAIGDPIDGINITVSQGGLVEMSVNASDIDGDALMYYVDSFNLTGIAATADPFTIEEDTGNITFTPGNDHVGMFEFTLNVTDGTDYVMHNFSFDVANVNDAPMIVDIDSVAPVDMMIALTATEDENFTAVVTASDIDLVHGDELTFAADMVFTVEKVSDTTANLTFAPTNDDVGNHMINVTVTDGDDTDYVHVNLTVTNVNDAPMVKSVRKGIIPSIPVDGMVDYSSSVLDKDDPNMTFTITADDVDVGDTLDWSQTNTSITSGVTLVEDPANMSVEVTIVGETIGNGTYELMFEVEDSGGSSDMVTVKIVVKIEDEVVIVNKAPTLTVTGSKSKKITLGDKLVVEGTFADEDGDDVYIMINVIDINNKDWGYIELELFASASSAFSAEVGEGTWSFTVDTETSAEFQEGKATLKFKAQDYNPLNPFADGDESAEVVVTATIEEEDDDDELTLSIGMFDYDIIIIIVIIIVILLVVVMMMKKKKKPAEEEAPPEEGMAPPAEMACPACGAMVPAGSEACPACGAAVPPPEAPMEEAPAEMACPACGAMIPAGAETCPACGAVPPPPEAPMEEAPPEMPPEEGMPMEEGMPPAEAPPEEAPMEEAPPEMPPEEGMPPEQPPAEAPPEEQPPAEAPPEEQPPAEGAPPAGMATCPTCGGQLAVGQTPCPACGAQLTW
jgi:RNA polymerase subunit RPABC4/transcription elongation factor Spt4